MSLTIGEIAQIEGLTPEYAGKLIRILRLGGLLASVRGRHGGYRLARPIDEISVGEVIAVLGGKIFDPDYCSRYTGDRNLCVHSVDCAIRSLWMMLQETTESILERIRLRDLMGTEANVGQLIRTTVNTFEQNPDVRVSDSTIGQDRQGPAPIRLIEIEDLGSPVTRRKEN